METTRSNHYDFLDVAAVIAICRVVFLHGLNNFQIVTTGKFVPFYTAPLWQQSLDILFRFSVPIFMLISGFKFYLSQQRHPEQTLWSFTKLRFKRLLRPYIFWTCLITVAVPLVLGNIPRSHPAYADYPNLNITTIWNIFNGAIHPAYQLWFVPMLFFVSIIYRTLPRLHWAITQTIFWSLLILIQINHLGIPWMFPMYFAYYDLGARLAQYKSRTSDFEQWYLRAGLFSLLMVFCATLFRLGVFHRHFLQFEYLLQEISVPIAFFLLTGFLFRNGGPHWITRFKKDVWPIFIIHEPLVLGQIGIQFYIRMNLQHPIFYFVTASMTLFTSWLIVNLIRKLRLEPWVF